MRPVLEPRPPRLPNPLPAIDPLEKPPRPAKPLGGLLEDVVLPAKELNLLPLAAPNGEAAADLDDPRPPKGDEAELEKLPKPDALNLSSEVCGSGVLSDVLDSCLGLAAIAANGDAAEVLAKPLEGAT